MSMMTEETKVTKMVRSVKECPRTQKAAINRGILITIIIIPIGKPYNACRMVAIPVTPPGAI
jgi:hypothetical protein